MGEMLKKEAKIDRAIGEKQHRRRDEREQMDSWRWDYQGAMHSPSSWGLFLGVCGNRELAAATARGG